MNQWRIPTYNRKGAPRVPPECSKVMPCGCDDAKADEHHGPHLRLFVWWGNRHRQPLGAWRCTSCGTAKPSSTEHQAGRGRVA